MCFGNEVRRCLCEPCSRQGGIAHIEVNGRTNFIMATAGDIPDDFIPNGYSLMPDGSFLIANVGNDGGVYTLNRDGTLVPFY